MTGIANLNKIRKQRQRDAGRKAAAENRQSFGLGKQTRKLSQLERQKQSKLLDGKLLDDVKQ